MSALDIQILLVDHDPVSRNVLRSLLQAEPEMQVAAECSTFPEALRLIRERTPDVAIIDAHFPELARAGSLEALGLPRIPAVIFTAVHPQALQAVSGAITDRLLKPFDREALERALLRAKLQVRRARDQATAHMHAGPPGARQYLQRFVVKTGERIFFIPVSDVHWIQSAANYVRLHVAGVAYTVRETMTHVESALDPARYLRVHRNAIVNLDHVQEFKTGPGGSMSVRMKSGTSLPLSRSYRSTVRSLLRRSI